MPVLRRLAVAAVCMIVVTLEAVAAPGVSVLDFGAKGDGTADDSAAFKAALTAGAHHVRVPAGTYAIGPEALEVPENVALVGDGRATVLKPAPGTGELLRLKTGARVRDLHVDGEDVEAGSVSDGLIVVQYADRCLIDSVSVSDCDRACIWADHGHDLTIRGCDFRKVGLGVSLAFSNRVKVLGNTVVDARVHGIQFWGNWEWESIQSEDLIFANNTVKNGGGGSIWGAGARRVVMTGNIIDGATDVGLDLEWCEDSVISGNTVRNCKNAGISLFFACKRVAITGNTVVNDREIDDPEATWFVRSGIWLTPPNREEFPGDHGHEDIAIVGNTVYSPPSEKGERRGMWVGSEVKNVRIESNAISGPGIFYGGHHKVSPLRPEPLEQPLLLNDRETPDRPKF